MLSVPFSGFLNNLLSRMTPDDLARLLPHLEPFELPSRHVLAEPGIVNDFTYFPEGGIGSIVVSTDNGQRAEVGLFGREGLAPISGVSGMPALPYHVLMQVAGRSHRISNAHLWGAMTDSATLRTFLGRYLHSVSLQIAYTAFASSVNKIEARLARWLLMCHDRSEGNTIELTHEALSAMLAIRRQSVTSALHILEGNHFIVASRGLITIRDRAGLRAFAGGAYGVPEREYAASIGGLLIKD